MRVGVARFVLSIPGSRSLKDRRRVVRSYKDRVRAKLPVSVAEVGNAERLQVATVAVAMVSSDAQRIQEVLDHARSMAGSLPEALLADARSEILAFGNDGEGLAHGLEDGLDGPAYGGGQADWSDADEDEQDDEDPREPPKRRLPGEGLIEPVRRKAKS
jgi:uncharacterized protein YlxP (DUF503 family)